MLSSPPPRGAAGAAACDARGDARASSTRAPRSRRARRAHLPLGCVLRDRGGERGGAEQQRALDEAEACFRATIELAFDTLAGARADPAIVQKRPSG